MSFWQSATALALAVGIAVSAAQAQTLRRDDGPAEYPPASYDGRQYVDSKGCVYIRAGYAGQVTWVPRVGRDREVICGFRPSLAKAAPAPAPQTATRPAPVRTVQKPARVAPPAAAPAAPPKVVRRPAPQAAPSQAVRTAPVQPAPKTTTRKVVRRGQPACQGASAISSQYINDGSRYPVRCGPQQEDPRGKVIVRPGSRAQGAPAMAPVRPAPLKIPKGYEKLWDDGRLNPMRGKGTARGEAQMALVWTNEVPRRLVEVPLAQAQAMRLSTKGK